MSWTGVFHVAKRTPKSCSCTWLHFTIALALYLSIIIVSSHVSKIAVSKFCFGLHPFAPHELLHGDSMSRKRVPHTFGI